MIERIAVILTVTETGIRLVDVESARSHTVTPLSLLLTLEKEAGAGFARGHIQDLARQDTYPFQSSAALFDRLQQYLEEPTPHEEPGL